MIKEYFKSWNKFEIIWVIVSTIAVIISGIVVKSEIITMASSIAVIITAVLQAKGKIESQFFSILVFLLYSYVSYKNRYYGEVICNLFILLPISIMAIISWITHKNTKTDTVEINEVKFKEWIVLFFISIAAFIGLYNLLKYFNTSQLVVSTFSMIMSILAIYLIARRSKYSFVFYIINDIILLILWGIPVIVGDFLLIPMVIYPLALLINDTYALFNWKKLEKEQSN